LTAVRRGPTMVAAMKKLLARLVLVVSAIVLSGCAGTVTLAADRYQPTIPALDVAAYKGKAVVLRNFENVDNATTLFAYPGNGRKYGGPLLTSYFWHCFREAFERMGVTVYEDGNVPAGKSAPVMDVRLVAIHEASYRVGVSLRGPAGNFRWKPFGITGPAVSSDDARVLERRAYQMMDALFIAIITDPEFRTTFVGPARE
jgi:hypothetical protein